MAFRYPAGLITAGSPVTPEYPSGVWTNQQAAPYINGQVWANDPFFNQTVLLLHGDGTNGAQNNTFLDSSSNNFTITRNGNTTQGTFSPFSVPEGYWGNYFDGSGDYLSVPNNAAFAYGTGDFTVEAWFYASSISAAEIPLYKQHDTTVGTTNNIVEIRIASSKIYGYIGQTSFGGTTTLSANTWYHVAYVRSGSTCTLYLNGVSEGSTASGGLNISTNPTTVRIATNQVANAFYTGYLSNLRILKGTALYTSNFTPPTAPLTAIANTSLLTCQSNRFIDNSTNNFTITRNGDVRVTPFDPFLPTGAYSPSVTGGSGYFDGSGDWLTAPNDAAISAQTSDFTWEAWVYWIGGQNENTLWCTDVTGGMNIGLAIGGQWAIGTRAIAVQNNFGAVPKNQWNYLAISRTGSTIDAYLNGTRVHTGSNSTNYVTGGVTGIGAIPTASANIFQGYLSGLRFSKGIGRYSGTSMTVPTAPPSPIANTSLLTNFTNAGILDNTMFNNLETVGNAQIDTTTKKYGTGAMKFDGTGDWITSFNGAATYSLGTIYTVEMWFYTNSVAAGNAGLINLATTSGGNTGFNLYRSSAEILCNNGATAGTGPSSGVSSISVNTWTHLAVTSDGTSTRIFLDGVLKNTYTGTTGSASVLLYATIGAFNDKTAPFNGYIDDLRITKGVARYTANFTPPIARFPNQ